MRVIFSRAIGILTQMDELITTRAIRAQMRLLIRHNYGPGPSAERWLKDYFDGLDRAERFFKNGRTRGTR